MVVRLVAWYYTRCFLIVQNFKGRKKRKKMSKKSKLKKLETYTRLRRICLKRNVGRFANNRLERVHLFARKVDQIPF